jgi:hypothetical protein
MRGDYKGWYGHEVKCVSCDIFLGYSETDLNSVEDNCDTEVICETCRDKLPDKEQEYYYEKVKGPL